MKKYLTYDKSLDLVRRFGTPRYDVYSAVYDGKSRRVARSWNVNTPDKVFKGVAVEIILDNCALIVLGIEQFEIGRYYRSNFYPESMSRDSLFAESIFQIDVANRTGNVKICRKLVDEWTRREDVSSYGESHRFLIDNRGVL